MQEFFEFAQQDNVVAILALLSGILMLFLFTMLVRRGYGGSGDNGDDDGEAIKSPMTLLLEIMGDTQRTMGKTLDKVVEIQESQGKMLLENTQLISDVRDDMKNRLQDHESAAENRTAETLEVIREASAAMALIPVSLQRLATDVGKNHEAIKAVKKGQADTDLKLIEIKQEVENVVATASDPSMLETILGVVNDLKGMVEQALASRVSVPVAAVGQPFTVALDEGISPPSAPPKHGGGVGKAVESGQPRRAVPTKESDGDEAAG